MWERQSCVRFNHEISLIAQIVTEAYISFEWAGGPTQNASHVKGNLLQRTVKPC